MLQTQSNQEIVIYTQTSKANQTVVPAQLRKYWGYKAPLTLKWEYNKKQKKVTVEALPLDADEWVKRNAGRHSKIPTNGLTLEQLRDEWDQ